MICGVQHAEASLKIFAASALCDGWRKWHLDPSQVLRKVGDERGGIADCAARKTAHLKLEASKVNKAQKR
jgi:hypothetical protein